MGAATEALVDYFRCPRCLVSCDAGESLSSDTGFFRFGPDTICFGRSSRGFRACSPDEALYDALADVLFGPYGLRLPFDFGEVLDNLRCERYATAMPGAGEPPHAIRIVYYTLRPLLPVFARKYMQRFRLRHWNRITFPTWPVDSTVERLMDRVLALSMKALDIDRLPFIWFWPGGAHSAVCLTHDVETMRGRDFCAELMDLDSSFGLTASFQIIPEDRYEITSAFLESLRSRGFEINIHDLNHDGHLFRDRQTFLERVDRINEYGKEFGAGGFRAGVLYRNPDWYDSLAFSYDMSIPNVAHLDPQRGGCCTVTPFYLGDLLELPLTTTQDYTLFHILGQYSIDLWRKQVFDIASQHGLISFNVHPDYLASKRARDCYLSLLTFLTTSTDDGHLWIARPGEINRWWREREQLRLVNNKGWRIEGTGSERARVAWAQLDDDHISYAIERRTS